MSIGLSTVYFSRNVKEADRLLGLIEDLGFDGIELEYRLTSDTLAAMLPLVKERRIRVFSIHNYLADPSDTISGMKGGSNTFLMSSLDRDERTEAIKATTVTMDVAGELGAGAVVLHLGHVEFDAKLDPYKKLVAAEKGDTPEARGLLKDYLSLRKTHRQPYLDSVLWCLDRLNREAERRSLTIGIENRYHLHEIPDHEEMGIILESFNGGSIRYWHDVGHSLNHQYLGVGTQNGWLDSFGERLAGIHLHDIVGSEDHLAPGTGEADFASILSFLPLDAVRIIEVNGKVPEEELLAGRDLLIKLGY